MTKTKQVSPDEALLGEVYKSVTMGVDSVSTLIEKTDDTALRADLYTQLGEYQKYATAAKTKMFEKNYKVKESSVFAKIPAEVSMNVTAMMDNSATKIAEMMITGSTAGVIGLTRKIRETPDASPECTQLARDVVAFEENSINRMKTYL